MYTALMAFIVGLFVALLFLNLYFRAKVLRLYKQLYQRRIEFKSRHIFSPALLEAEVIPAYPESADLIRQFTSHIRYSIKIAVLLLLLISVVSYLLYTYR